MNIKYYADSDTNGNIIGFYNDDIHDIAKIPNTVIEITEEQWQDAIANQKKYIISVGAFVLAPVSTTEQQLADIKINKIAEFNINCNKEILAGFKSSALGVSHDYGFDVEDQANLSGTLSLLNANTTITSVDWKTQDAGILAHTKEQFVTLCTDSFTHKQSKISKYWGLKVKIEASLTLDEVKAIVWS